MKILCSLLITVLVMHLECGGSCFAESFGAKAHAAATNTEPPCHKAAEKPSNSPQPSDAHNSVCSQGPLIESKLSVGGKPLLQSTAVLPALTFVLQPGDSSIRQYVPKNPPGLVPLLVPASILRI
jgi:hypothetical protein